MSVGMIVGTGFLSFLISGVPASSWASTKLTYLDRLAELSLVGAWSICVWVDERSAWPWRSSAGDRYHWQDCANEKMVWSFWRSVSLTWIKGFIVCRDPRVLQSLIRMAKAKPPTWMWYFIGFGLCHGSQGLEELLTVPALPFGCEIGSKSLECARGQQKLRDWTHIDFASCRYW
jgi:hypothetical protein